MAKYKVQASNLVKDGKKGRNDDGKFYAPGDTVTDEELAFGGADASALVRAGAIAPASAEAAKPAASK